MKNFEETFPGILECIACYHCVQKYIKLNNNLSKNDKKIIRKICIAYEHFLCEDDYSEYNEESQEEIDDIFFEELLNKYGYTNKEKQI